MEASPTPFDRRTTDGAGTDGAPSNRKALTIGAVAKILSREFEDISISKIRYLEDQKLLSPRRTPGGYRLYSQADVERLRTILRMQRDEFLPLRVIRQELAAGAREERGGAASLRRAASVEAGKGVAAHARGARRPDGRRGRPDQGSRGLAAGPAAARSTAPSSTTTPTARSSRPAPSSPGSGWAGRNLKVLRTAADREAVLLEAVVGPGLRSTNHNARRRRRSRTWRASPRPAATSRTCCWSATCGS